MKITVLGCGRWGSFITWYLSKNGHEVTEWGREDGKSYRVLKETGKNDYVTLNKNVALTSDLKSALSGAELVVISVLSQSLRELLSRPMNEGLKGKKVVLCMKGLEEATGKRLSEIAKECGVDGQNLAIWVGPGHIEEFLKGKPNLMVIDSENRELTRFIADGLRSNLIRFYYGDDLLGNEVGAAAKNVMGIAAGMLDGLNYTSLKGALMARGTREIARLIKALGGNEMSAYGLCHLGDYEATLFSKWSHNRMYGESFAKGNRFTKLAEGVMTSKALYKLGQEYGVDLPIVESVYKVLFDGTDIKEALGTLFMRSVKKEF